MRQFRLASMILLSSLYGLVNAQPFASEHGQYFHFDFSHTNGEWTTGFADYLVGTEADAEQDVEENAVFIQENGPALSGLKLHSINLSSETTMYATRQLPGFIPNQTYQVALDLSFASNVGTECMGIGASPGDVMIKAGVTNFEPELTLDMETYMRLNVDTGNQRYVGKHMMDLGRLGHENIASCDPSVYVFQVKQQSSQPQYFEVQTDETGSLWVTVATDSGFAGSTTIYLLDMQLLITPAESENAITT